MTWCSRLLLSAFVLTCQGLISAAQQPLPNSWDRLKGLPASTHLRVTTGAGKARCTLTRVTDEQILCDKASYARPEIRSVQLIRHGASTVHGLLIGLGTGAGGGAIVGAALGNDAFSTPGRGAAVGIAIFAPLGAGIGAAVGRAGDHDSRVIYLR